MRNGGEGRARLLLVILIVTSLFLITLDLRGVKVIEGFKQGTQTVLSPFQRAGAGVLNPVKDFFSDVTHLGRTRSQIEKLEAENANLKIKLLNRKNADSQLKQLESILDLAGTAGFKIVNARVISHGSSQSFSQTITIDAGSNAGIKKNIKPHTLRHTFATHLLNRGTGLETLKDLLGHANLSATQVYTHNSFAQLTAVYAQAHPRGMQKTK